MKVGSNHYRTIWIDANNPEFIKLIDQRHLPHKFVVESVSSVQQMAIAIKDMHVRGAGLIGAAAGYGMYLAALEARKSKNFDLHMQTSAEKLLRTRPTAVNLAWAVTRQQKSMATTNDLDSKLRLAKDTAEQIADEDALHCQEIGRVGVEIIKEMAAKKRGPVQILTHCNAGWLAFVDFGSATAPIYEAHRQGIDLHVWVDETRPRNQGARLTAWELQQEGIAHTVIVDNAGGHLMQHGQVDLLLTGTDRTTRTGDVANKIGTYLKALAAYDNKIPFYVALPSSSFDWKISDGLREIPIESRNQEEVKYISGLSGKSIKQVQLCPKESNASNYAFDVTPAHLVTGLITERGICEANENAILKLFPEQKIPQNKTINQSNEKQVERKRSGST
ncbi:MAG: S-methyl-5-thioribose-1-phosphate isomerase [Saprospiraceae bacterium]|nr:S-methyl-5-thioribose-1-phosphate isomerase [Saprospiraceae bacterium]